MKIIPFYARGWEANSYLAVCDGQAALIDAGASAQAVCETLKKENAVLKYIILTHGHFDHTVCADRLREMTGAALAIHMDDAEMLADAEKSALALFFGRYDTVKDADILLKDGGSIQLGGESITLIHTPGHSRGSSCFLVGDALFTGDTIFNGGYGRYDLHGGDADTLFASLSSLKALDGELDIYPGHGDTAKLKTALQYLNIL